MKHPRDRGVFAERVRSLGFHLLHRVPEQAQGALMEFADDLLIDSEDEELYQEPCVKEYRSRWQGKPSYQKM